MIKKMKVNSMYLYFNRECFPQTSSQVEWLSNT